MEEEDIETSSCYSDYSILPDSNEVEAMNSLQPEVADGAARSPLDLNDSEIHPVEFLNVCTSYFTNQDLVLHYTFLDTHKPTVTDRLGLYQTGFTSVQTYITYEWAPRARVSDSEPILSYNEEKFKENHVYSVTFPKNNLPNDEAEFYQVCYLDDHQLIKGASSPFQLMKKMNEGESLPVVSSLEQSDGSVLVTNDLTPLHANNNMLQEQIKLMETQIQKLKLNLIQRDDAIKEYSEESATLKKNKETLMMQHQRIHDKYSDSIRILEGRVTKLKDERNELLATLESARVTNSDIMSQIEELNKINLAQSKEYEEKCEQVQEQIMEMSKKMTAQLEIEQGLREQLSNTSDQLSALKQKQAILEIHLRKAEDRFYEAEAQLKSREEEHDMLKERHSAHVDEYLKYFEEHENTVVELEALRLKVAEQDDKLNSIESRKTAEVENTARQLKQCMQELKDSEARRAVLDDDNMALKENFTKVEQECRQLQAELEDAGGQREGAEKVASVMREKVDFASQKLTQLRKAHKKLNYKFLTLSAYIMNQKDAESIDALINLNSSLDPNEDVVYNVSLDMAKHNGDASTSWADVSSTTSSLAALDVSGSENGHDDEIEAIQLNKITIENRIRISCSTPNGSVCGEERPLEKSQYSVEAEHETSVITETSSEDNESHNAYEDESHNACEDESHNACEDESHNACEDESHNVCENNESYNNNSSYNDSIDVTSSEANDSSFEDNCSSDSTLDDNNTSLKDTSIIESSATENNSFNCSMQLDNIISANDTEESDEAFLDASTQLPSHDAPKVSGMPSAPAVDDVFIGRPSALNEVSTEGAVGGAPAPDSDETPKSQDGAHSEEQYLYCPMCPLKFGPKSMALLHQHIESHLEFICPICSTAFQRSSEKAFNEHVNCHLDAEEREVQSDRSGPWGRGPINWPEMD